MLDTLLTVFCALLLVGNCVQGYLLWLVVRALLPAATAYLRAKEKLYA